MARRANLNVTFAPAGRFFLRVVPLAADAPPLAQAELALEGVAPFPLAQLYWGCCVSVDRTQALVYAAHRRRFTAEETAAWDQADLVVPDLLPLLGALTARPEIAVHTTAGRLAGVAGGGPAALPAAVLARSCDGEAGEQALKEFAAELAQRAGLSAAPMRKLSGEPRAVRQRDRICFELADGGAVAASFAVPLADIDLMDVRDRTLQPQRRKERGRRETARRLLLACGALAALAAAADLGAGALGLATRARRMRIDAQAPLVQELETAQGMGARINELSQRRLKFFEMLAAVNTPRPGSVQFLRTSNRGLSGLDIEAQTGSAADVNVYEASLRGLAALERVEVRDLRTRDGVTTFTLAVDFRPEKGGAP